MKKLLPVVISALIFGAAYPAASDEIEDLQTYCKPDIERLCAGVPIGGGGIKDCLRSHEKEISVGCAQALKKLKDG